jgi:TRAP-type C4-dicarboxylate transport system permease large subunit
VVAAVYALFVSMVVYREMSWARLYAVFLNAAKTTAVVMFLCGAATVTAYMITLADLPNMLAESFAGVLGNPMLFMALMMLFLLVVGTAMDLAVKAGIDPVYFGFMFIYVGCIGLITPPVGTVQNVVAGVGRLRMETVIKGTTPFLIAYVLLAVLLVIFPQIVTAPLKWMH